MRTELDLTILQAEENERALVPTKGTVLATRGVVGELEKGAVDDVAEWLTRLIDQDIRSEAARRNLKSGMRIFVRWYRKHCCPGGVPFDGSLVDRFMGYGETERRWSPARYNDMLQSLKRVALRLARGHLITMAMYAEIDTFENKKDRGIREKEWYGDEERKAIKAAFGPTLIGIRDRALVCIALDAGLRKMEVNELKFSQFQKWDEQWILADVRTEKQAHEEHRTLPILPETAQNILVWKELSGLGDDNYLAHGLTRDGLNPNKPLISEGGMRCICEDLTERVGFKVTWQGLRRTYLNRLYKAGVDKDTICYLAGHDDFKVTQEYYIEPESRKVPQWHKMDVVPCDYLYDTPKEIAKEEILGEFPPGFREWLFAKAAHEGLTPAQLVVRRFNWLGDNSLST